MDDLMNSHPKSNDNSIVPNGSGLGSMMSGGNKGNRQEDDFYPTPIETILPFIEAERKILDFFAWHKIPVWEPACGDGRISKELQGIGLDVISTDLKDRGFGIGGKDFLKEKSPSSTPIITNPPYDDYPEKFIRHAVTLQCPYLALLLKSNYFHTIGHGKLHDEFPPSREYKMTWRTDFMNLGRPTMTASWFVWDFISPRKSQSPEVFIMNRISDNFNPNQQEMFK